ncbi:DUF6850 family outer membrane beta-barrel protein [Membranihabitans marinus]|uniref:DUF6850 family outer membrane beta-barrel protein n=1 Tax=Membranihabitans marinus TaxID=1227546 RepID=UPI001F3DD8FB|nr:DUF6850 family outer membrane beta-barrel protein [Membranihabitans marinus]
MNKVLLLLLLLTAFIESTWSQQAQDTTTQGSVAMISIAEVGSFRPAMAPHQSYDFGFITKGKTTIDQWQLEGKFAYQRQLKQDLLFAGVLDPYNGNPFIWGDTISGNWQHDGFDTYVDITMPKYKNHIFSLALDYINGTGARHNGPKPFYRYREIKIAPRVKTLIAKREDHYINLGLYYTSAFEENEIGYYAIDDTYLIRGRGFGSLLKGPINSLDRRRNSNKYGLNLKWFYADKWHIDFNSQFRHDGVSDGLSNPNEEGSYTEFQSLAQVKYHSEEMGWKLFFNYRTGSTDDAVYGFRNSESQHIQTRVTIDINRHRNMIFLPDLSLELLYCKQEDYIVQADYQSLNLIPLLEQVSNIGQVQLSYYIGYQFNLDKEESVLEFDILNRLVYTPDFEYLTSDHVFIGLAPTFHLGNQKTHNKRYFISIKNKLMARHLSSMRYRGELALGINL